MVIDSRENVSSQMKATERDIQPLPADIDRSLSLSETLGDIYDKMPTQDKIALLTAPIPIVGDIAGGIADVMAISVPSAVCVNALLMVTSVKFTILISSVVCVKLELTSAFTPPVINIPAVVFVKLPLK